MTVVRLENLSQTYNGRHTAVRDLTLTIPAGQITALLGPSGCGKTTTLKMIAGLLEPTNGRVLFNSLDVTAIPAERRSAVMAFQNHLLFPYMTVTENVGFGLKMRGVTKDLIQEKVNTLLNQVQLDGYGNRKPSELSGGQQQRVSLARALITEPEVLLLDEPLSNLDAHLRDEMRELILQLQRQNKLTTIFVTHDQEEAVILADQIALMFAGEVQQFAQPRDFYDRPSTAQVARFFGNHNILEGKIQKNGRFLLNNSQDSLQLPSNLLKTPHQTQQLTIRPEHIQLAENTPSDNRITAIVEQCIYRGTHTRLTVSYHNTILAVSINSHISLPIGESVSIRLPQEHLWSV